MLIVFGFICPGFKMSASVIYLLFCIYQYFFPLFGHPTCSADADKICRDGRCNKGLQLAPNQGRCSYTVCILPTSSCVFPLCLNHSVFSSCLFKTSLLILQSALIGQLKHA